MAVSSSATKVRSPLGDPILPPAAGAVVLPDLNSPERIEDFIDQFYAQVLRDPLLAPVFLEQAAIDIKAHLPRIKAYWEKMLLGHDVYHRHMMQKHRNLDSQDPFRKEQYERWLALFEATLKKHHSGPHADRARTLARRVAGNMRRNFERFRA